MIDLLFGGSPCQGFSFAGKQLNFFDPRSKLFFDYIKAKEELKPKYFLLENVKMKKEFEDVITQHMGIEPIEINSSLVSGQVRKRLYWTNIPNIQQPKDKGILLKDVIESGEVLESKSQTIKNQYWKSSTANFARKGSFHATGVIERVGNVNPSGRGMNGNVYSVEGKSPTLTTNKGEGIKITDQCIQIGIADVNGHDILKRVYSVEGKSPTLTAVCGGNQERKIAIDDMRWRKLTPIECERLQTLPDNYTDGISNSQRYKAIGNGWTVDVIAHILSFIQDTYLHTVVSLFDGISCGQVALERSGKTYNQYYASEIDKYAIQITQKNYPHTMQLGDVTKIDWKQFLERVNIIQKVS